jgi:hypothetical protein
MPIDWVGLSGVPHEAPSSNVAGSRRYQARVRLLLPSPEEGYGRGEDTAILDERLAPTIVSLTDRRSLIRRAWEGVPGGSAFVTRFAPSRGVLRAHREVEPG